MWYKLWAVFKAYFISSIEYRFELLLWALLTLASFGLMFIIWGGILRGQSSAQGYQLSQIIQYYLIAAIIGELTASHFESWRVVQIREGKIDLFMTRPLSYLLDIFVGDIASKAVYLVLSFPLYALLFAGLYISGLLSSMTISSLVAGQFMLLLLSTFLIEFLIGLIIVILSFWFENSEGLEHFKWITINLFSGWLIPVAFMPAMLRTAVLHLPFQYMYAVPIGLLQGKAQLKLTDVLYELAFIAGLFGIALFLWSKARKKYGSYGG